jgi:two-component system nitrogen regulation response regulator NtrX
VAHQIHALSPRYSKPMVEVNCAAIPEEMIESELFGEEKINSDGHFSIKRGKFDLAHGGTLFLDEIADMSSKTQSKILRIIEEKKFERIGGLTSIVVDVRLIAATNKDLKVEIEKGNFREDLYHRLNVVPLVLPSLRNRKDDCSVLAEHFLKEFSVTHGKLYRPLTEEAVRILEAYSWPGNVRELKNLMERIVILTTEIENGKAISADLLLSHLKNEIGHINPGESSLKSTATTDSTSESMAHYLSGSLKDARQNFEREYILKVLKENHWNVSKVAQLLGVERSNLHKKIKSYGLDSAETEPEK